MESTARHRLCHISAVSLLAHCAMTNERLKNKSEVAFHRIIGSSGHNSYYKPNAVIGSCVPIAINKHLGTEAGMVSDRIIPGESFGILWLPSLLCGPVSLGRSISIEGQSKSPVRL